MYLTWDEVQYIFLSNNMIQVLPVVPAKHNPHYLIFKSCKSLGWLKQKFYLLLCTFWSVLQYNVRMLFPSIEIDTAMNARESEKYLPSSRSLSASKQCRDFVGRDISGTTFFQGRDKSRTTFNINNRKQFQITAHPIFCRFTIYWFPVYHFRCMKVKPLVIWIWNQNIAISTIVGTSSHIILPQHLNFHYFSLYD